MDRGERFKREIRAKAAALGMPHDKDIAEKAGVSENTLRNWWNGKGLELGTLVAVAGVIESSVFDLLDVWQSDKPHDYQRLPRALNGLTAELRASRKERASFEARLRAVEGALALRALSGDGAHEGRSVPDGTAG